MNTKGMSKIDKAVMAMRERALGVKQEIADSTRHGSSVEDKKPSSRDGGVDASIRHVSAGDKKPLARVGGGCVRDVSAVEEGLAPSSDGRVRNDTGVTGLESSAVDKNPSARVGGDCGRAVSEDHGRAGRTGATHRGDVGESAGVVSDGESGGVGVTSAGRIRPRDTVDKTGEDDMSDEGRESSGRIRAGGRCAGEKTSGADVPHITNYGSRPYRYVRGGSVPDIFSDGDVCRLIGKNRNYLIVARKATTRGKSWDVIDHHAGMTAEWILKEMPTADLGKIIQWRIKPGDGVVTVEVVRHTPDIRKLVCRRLSDGETVVVTVDDSSRFVDGIQFDAQDLHGSYRWNASMNRI